MPKLLSSIGANLRCEMGLMRLRTYCNSYISNQPAYFNLYYTNIHLNTLYLAPYCHLQKISHLTARTIQSQSVPTSMHQYASNEPIFTESTSKKLVQAYTMQLNIHLYWLEFVQLYSMCVSARHKSPFSSTMTFKENQSHGAGVQIVAGCSSKL